MIAALIVPLTFLAALGSAVMAGTFFAFSNFVMPALGRLPAEQGIAAMQSVNRVVMNPIFLGVFMGTMIVSVVLGLIVVPSLRELPSMLMLVAALLYVLGCFGVTIVFNVPLNNALDAVQAASPEGAAFWQRYLGEWVFWNTVRTVLPLIGVGLFMAALMLRN